MPNFNITSALGTANGLPYGTRAAGHFIEVTVDHSKFPIAQNETGQVLRIPAKCRVLFAGAEIIRPEGEAATIHLGDAALADGYLTSLNANAAAGTVTTTELALITGTPNTVAKFSAGKTYNAAATLQVTCAGANTLNVAVIRYFAFVVDLR